MLDFSAGNPQAMAMLADSGQAHIISVAFYLDPVITAAGVRRLLPVDMAGHKRIGSYLAMLEHMGALTPAEHGDGRARARAITPWFHALLKDWLKAIVRPGRRWLPQPWPDLECPANGRRWFGQFVEAHARGGRMLDSAPSIAHMLSLKGGYVLLFELMRRTTLPPGEPQPAFSRRDFAQRFGLSRTHVIDLLARAAEHGLIETEARSIKPSAALVAEGRIWLTMHLAVAVLTLQDRLSDELLALKNAASTRTGAASGAELAAPTP
jgi:hypothetical protein